MSKRVRRTILRTIVSSIVMAGGFLLVLGAAGMSDAGLELRVWGSRCITGILLLILGRLIGEGYE